MKKLLSIGCMLALATTASRALDKPELDNQIRKLAIKFDELQQKADKRIPAENLKKALGIVLLDRTKAGFIFAYQGGSGVGMAKDPKSDSWSPVAFYKANEASLGFQIGGQKSFLVILLMDTNATQLLTGGNVDFGGEASGTAGDASGKAEGTVSPKAAALVYDDRKGLYGGAAIKGGDISADDGANIAYYGQGVTAREILFEKKVKGTEAANELAKKINGYMKAK